MTRALSRNQRLVLEALQAAGDRALSAYEVLAILAPAGLRGPPSIYRALEALCAAGLTHRIESINAFAACAHPHAHRPAFAVCRDCKAVTELEDRSLGRALGRAGAASGFTVDASVVEFVGRCPDCRDRPPPGDAA